MKFTDLGPREPDVKPPLLYRDIEPGGWFVSDNNLFLDTNPRLRTSRGHIDTRNGYLHEGRICFDTTEVTLLTDVDLQYRKVD